MDPKVEECVAEIQKVKEAKESQEKLEKVFDEFNREIDLYRTEDSHLKDYRSLFESLDQEKKAHVEELRNINNDMNTLESGIKHAESEQIRSWENARQLMEKMRLLVVEVNRVRASLGEELIPEGIFKHEDIQLLEQPLHQQNPQPPPTLPAAWFSMISRDFSMPAFFDRAALYGQHPGAGGGPPSGHLAGLSALRQPGMSLVSGSRSTNVEGNGASGEMQGSPEMGGASGFGKQQPPPMKTCNSCQQQIHRNAPICPMCKSKSRSKNPKKPKRKMDEF